MSNNVVNDLVKALEGVIRVADRKTDEFDVARAALAKALRQNEVPVKCCGSVDVVCVCAGSDDDCPGKQAPPCAEFVAGATDRCAWCDHEAKCHAASPQGAALPSEEAIDRAIAAYDTAWNPANRGRDNKAEAILAACAALQGQQSSPAPAPPSKE